VEADPGAPESTIGVVDTGFDFFHPALKGRVTPGYFASGVYHTTSFGLVAHGTLVCGLLAARNVGDGGMVGFAPDCPVLAASLGMPEHGLILAQQRFFAEHPGADMVAWRDEMAKHGDELKAFGTNWIDYVSRTMAEGITYLVDHGARVINISAFLPTNLLSARPEFVERVNVAFKHAAERDVVMVIGAGNNAVEVTDYPGSVDTVLVVGASTLADQRWTETVDAGGMKITQGSCYGPRLSVLAPAENLLIAQPHDKACYAFESTPMGAERVPHTGDYQVTPSGATSSATAVVSALAALVRSLRPDLSATNTVRVVRESAVDIGDPGPDPLTGSGRVDFLRAVSAARDWPRG
jgi:subtilisin family serine protease